MIMFFDFFTTQSPSVLDLSSCVQPEGFKAWNFMFVNI